MKGLLHRLAARAAGTAVPVRSDVRLPFGDARRGRGEAIEVAREALVTEDANGEPLATGAKRRVGSAPTIGADDVVAPTLDERSAARPDPAHDTRADAVLRSPMLERSDSSRAPPLLEATRADAVPPSPMLARSDSNAAPPLLEVPPMDAASAVAPQAGTIEPTRRSAMAQSSNSSERIDQPMPFDSEPALLMPRGAAETASELAGSGPGAARAAAWPNVAAEEPTEVHIHIGRIDVTAAHEVPPPRRRAAPVPAPMSLEAYFARRARS